MEANAGVQYDEKGFPILNTERGTLFDYDLNIYHLEEEIKDGSFLEGFEGTHYEYTDQWYFDIYEYLGNTQVHVAGPFEFTKEERNMLELMNPEKWGDDSWYGLWGFLKDYKDQIHPRLLEIFASLPKYKEEVLF